MHTRPRMAGLLLPLLLAVALPTAAATPATPGARSAGSPAQILEALLSEGRADEAASRGLALLDEHAGDPQFDFQFGLAALETGRFDHAALAFRRVLLLRPQSDRARLELARVYFLTGDSAAARTEFQHVLRRQPPPQVADHINRFLDAIDRREDARESRLSPSLALRFGYDDNVGNATDRNIFLVALPGIPFSVQREKDAFAELNAALEYQRPLSKRWGLFASGGYTHRGYQEVEGFDLGALDLRGGAVRVEGAQRLRLPVQLQVLSLDGEHYRNLASVGAEWSRALGARTEIGLLGQLASVRYPDLPEYDVDGLNLGLMLSYRTAGGGLQLSGGVFAGSEEASDPDGEHNGRDFFGARVNAAWGFAAGHTLEASGAWQDVSYAAVQPMFGITRDDEVLQAELAWSWRPSARWQWRTAALYYDSSSSISLYDYDRLQLITGVRYVWK